MAGGDIPGPFAAVGLLVDPRLLAAAGEGSAPARIKCVFIFSHAGFTWCGAVGCRGGVENDEQEVESARAAGGLITPGPGLLKGDEDAHVGPVGHPKCTECA